MTFVGTATGSGKTVDNVPWSFTGTASQSFTKKSGGGSTGGGFSARNGDSWFAQSSGSFFYSIEDDGLHFGSVLRIAANMPDSLVLNGTVSATAAGSFTVTTDEILFYSGTYDWSGVLFSFQSPHAFSFPGLLFPGTHSVAVNARSLASAPYERVFERSNVLERHIRLTSLPDGFASNLGRSSGEFRNSDVFLARNGSAALMAAPISNSWSSDPDDFLFVWKQDERAAYTGMTSDRPLAMTRDGDMMISMGPNYGLVRTTQAGREVIPDQALADGFVMASDDGDTILVNWIYETYGTAIWRSGIGVQPAPTPPGFVSNQTYVSLLTLSGDGRFFSSQWFNQPAGHGLAETGAYIASTDGSSMTLTGDFVATVLNSDGSVAGGYRTTETRNIAALRIGDQVDDLPMPEGTLGIRLISISEDGSVALGRGYHPMYGELSYVWADQQVFTLNEYFHRQRVEFPGVDLKPAYPFFGKAMGSDGKTFAFHATASNIDEPSNYVSRQFVVRIPTPCPADLSLDRMVDDADFVLFVASYDNFLCPETEPASCWADLNHDNYVDDQDFVIFVAAYDVMLCP